MPDLVTTIWIHLIAAVPPTLAAIAAVITSVRTKQKTQEIHVLVNGERMRLLRELDDLRAQLAQKADHV